MKTLRQQIEALPEPERSARRAFYDDDEWNYSWELNAYPFQIEPASSDWKYWTIVAPPNSGKSYAGEYWAWNKFFNLANVLCIFSGGGYEMDLSFKRFMNTAELWSGHFDYDRIDGVERAVSIRDRSSKRSLRGMSEDAFLRGAARGMMFDYVWADEVFDAAEIAKEYPMAEKYLFTQPTKLHPDTIVSRAGDGRTF
jgi:hypothetical protein